MMRFALTMLLVGASLGLAASPALAGKSDDAWATCIWEQAPTSASNWLTMTPVKSTGPMDKSNRYKLLATRLQGFCQKLLTPSGKKGPPSFDLEGVRSSLQRIRPQAIGPDRATSNAIRCEMFEGDILLGVTIGFGDAQGLKPLPPVTALKCQRIQDDGSLQDA